MAAKPKPAKEIPTFLFSCYAAAVWTSVYHIVFLRWELLFQVKPTFKSSTSLIVVQFFFFQKQSSGNTTVDTDCTLFLGKTNLFLNIEIILQVSKHLVVSEVCGNGFKRWFHSGQSCSHPMHVVNTHYKNTLEATNHYLSPSHRAYRALRSHVWLMSNIHTRCRGMCNMYWLDHIWCMSRIIPLHCLDFKSFVLVGLQAFSFWTTFIREAKII